jgi:hypothetical protein
MSVTIIFQNEASLDNKYGSENRHYVGKSEQPAYVDGSG